MVDAIQNRPSPITETSCKENGACVLDDASLIGLIFSMAGADGKVSKAEKQALLSAAGSPERLSYFLDEAKRRGLGFKDEAAGCRMVCDELGCRLACDDDKNLRGGGKKGPDQLPAPEAGGVKTAKGRCECRTVCDEKGNCKQVCACVDEKGAKEQCETVCDENGKCKTVCTDEAGTKKDCKIVCDDKGNCQPVCGDEKAANKGCKQVCDDKGNCKTVCEEEKVAEAGCKTTCRQVCDDKGNCKTVCDTECKAGQDCETVCSEQTVCDAEGNCKTVTTCVSSCKPKNSDAEKMIELAMQQEYERFQAKQVLIEAIKKGGPDFAANVRDFAQKYPETELDLFLWGTGCSGCEKLAGNRLDKGEVGGKMALLKRAVEKEGGVFADFKVSDNGKGTEGWSGLGLSPSERAGAALPPISEMPVMVKIVGGQVVYEGTVSERNWLDSRLSKVGLRPLIRARQAKAA